MERQQQRGDVAVADAGSSGAWRSRPSRAAAAAAPRPSRRARSGWRRPTGPRTSRSGRRRDPGRSRRSSRDAIEHVRDRACPSGPSTASDSSRMSTSIGSQSALDGMTRPTVSPAFSRAGLTEAPRRRTAAAWPGSRERHGARQRSERGERARAEDVASGRHDRDSTPSARPSPRTASSAPARAVALLRAPRHWAIRSRMSPRRLISSP